MIFLEEFNLESSINPYANIEKLLLMDESTISDYELNTMYMVEGERLNKLITKGKEVINNIIDWIIRVSQYLKQSVMRLYNASRAQKLQNAINKAEAKGQPTVMFDDIPGDVYDNLFESYMFNEANNSSNNEMERVVQFGKDVIKHKKIVINTICKFIPGVNVAQVTIGTGKVIATLLPVALDFMAATKEIAMLQNKYAGKIKKIKDPQGNIIMEIPAEEYIKVDKYRGVCNRMLDLLVNKQSKEYSFDIRSTDDLITFGKVFVTKLSDMDVMGDEWKEKDRILFDEYQKISKEMHQSELRLVSDNRELVQNSEEYNKLSQPYRDKTRKAWEAYLQKSKAAEPSQGKQMMNMMTEMLTIISDAASQLLKLYDKRTGTSYVLNGKAICEDVATPARALSKMCLDVAKDLESMHLQGELSVKTALQVIERVGPSVKANTAPVKGVIGGMQQDLHGKKLDRYLTKESSDSDILRIYRDHLDTIIETKESIKNLLGGDL